MLGLAILGWLLDATELGSMVNAAWIDAKVRGQGLEGALAFLLVGGFFTALGLPRQVIAFLGGYAFDIALGTLLGTLAALLGCALAFTGARHLVKSVLHPRLSGRVARFDRFVRTHPVAMTVLIRLLPVGSNLVTNLAAGISGIRSRHFLAGSFIGYIPQTMVFALIGSGVHLAPVLKLSLAIGLFLMSSALGMWLYRRFRRSRSLDDTGRRQDEAR
jgi:uncharacterized membrane protein YdjX (TVP38/TMEM64 family)